LLVVDPVEVSLFMEGVWLSASEMVQVPLLPVFVMEPSLALLPTGSWPILLEAVVNQIREGRGDLALHGDGSRNEGTFRFQLRNKISVALRLLNLWHRFLMNCRYHHCKEQDWLKLMQLFFESPDLLRPRRFYYTPLRAVDFRTLNGLGPDPPEVIVSWF
jgi:hypothetical protein